MTKTLAVVALAVALSQGVSTAQNDRTPEALFKAAQHREEVLGDLRGAIELYQNVVATSNRTLGVEALVRIAECYQKLGDPEARSVYQRIVRRWHAHARRTPLALDHAARQHDRSVTGR